MSLRNWHLIHIHTLLEPPILLLQLDIVPTHLTLPHYTILTKRPILKAITSLPFHAIVGILILIPELYCNFVVGEREQFLTQPIILFFLPFGGQECDNFIMTTDEFVTVTPDTVSCVGLDDFFRISGMELRSLCV
jgi:hypothetical protein